jgi:hypothetical protein
LIYNKCFLTKEKSYKAQVQELSIENEIIDTSITISLIFFNSKFQYRIEFYLGNETLLIYVPSVGKKKFEIKMLIIRIKF